MLRLTAILSVFLLPAVLDAQAYRVEKIDVPQDIRLEVGGMGFWPDGTLVMCTRRGEVWMYQEGRFERFAFGLHEPLGLLTGDTGEIWVMQRGELSRIVDTDGDRVADLFETLNQEWGYTGNYHQYAFGLIRDAGGNFYGTLGLGFIDGGDRFKGRWLGTPDEVKYRGWVIQITPEGEFVPFAPGLRAPNGIGLSPEGEIFTTDNQGSYVACGWLMHVRNGEFLGHPSGLIDDPSWDKPWELPREKLNERRKRPVLFLPHGTMGNSTSQPLWDTTDGKFGPFAGHVLLGEVQNGKLGRATMEMVDGEYQGACYPFLFDRLGGGVNRMVFDDEGTLWIGFTGRGWAAGEGLRKVEFTGEVPHELHTMSLTRNGFDLRFTRPLERDGALDAGNYSLQHFQYDWHSGYGSAPANKTGVQPSEVTLSDDGRVVHLVLPELKAEKVYELNLKGLTAIDGSKLAHQRAFYTVNRLRK